MSAALYYALIAALMLMVLYVGLTSLSVTGSTGQGNITGYIVLVLLLGVAGLFAFKRRGR